LHPRAPPSRIFQDQKVVYHKAEGCRSIPSLTPGIVEIGNCDEEVPARKYSWQGEAVIVTTHAQLT
jgi:hypothetical protein